VNRWRLLLPLMLLVVLVFPAACTPAGPEVADNIGEPENPIVMSFVPSGDQEDIVTGGDKIAELLAAETGLAIESNVATSYAAVIEAMGAGNAHMAWLNTFNYLLANEKFGVEPLLVTSRYGTTSYAGQILTRADSGITTLEDLAGAKFCRPDALSTSGWVIPSITLKAAGVEEDDLGEIIEAGNHDAVVTAIYNGDCDAGATYVDARDGVEEELPDVKDVVVVIEVSDQIPNDNVSVISALPAEMKTKLLEGLLAIAQTDEGVEALQTTYGIEALEIVDDTFYDDFRATLSQAGVNVEELTEE
jgi:phosphonate transport system substrate-binding protein